MKDPKGQQRPKCPWCGDKLLFRRLTKTWVCGNLKCGGSPLPMLEEMFKDVPRVGDVS